MSLVWFWKICPISAWGFENYSPIALLISEQQKKMLRGMVEQKNEDIYNERIPRETEKKKSLHRSLTKKRKWLIYSLSSLNRKLCIWAFSKRYKSTASEVGNTMVLHEETIRFSKQINSVRSRQIQSQPPSPQICDSDQVNTWS